VDKVRLGFIGYFCRAIRGEEQLRLTGEDGLRTAEVVSAAYLSAWLEGKVELPLRGEDPDFDRLFADLQARVRA
jgi:hypothetical protein